MPRTENPRIAKLEGMVGAAVEAARWNVLERQSSEFLKILADEYGPRPGNVLSGEQRLLGLDAWRILRKRGLVEHDKSRPE